MQFILIVALSIVSCVVYGILHDQVTARICVEYFTIGHPLIIRSESPTLLALAWGVVATWWVGAILGVPLAIAARAGRWPKKTALDLLGPMALLMIVTAACALVAGTVGWLMARQGTLHLLEPLASRVPPDRHVAFLVDLCSHTASYAAGFIGGIGVIAMTLVVRRRAARLLSGQPNG